MENTPLFYVLLEGRRMGPYDRRTIVGMRIKKTLTSDHVLEEQTGGQLTVGHLLGRKLPLSFNPDRSGSFSLVQATYSASLIEAKDGPLEVPKFKGEVEARVQGDVLRVAGRFREGFGWKEDRVKIPLDNVAHARIVGSRVDLWLRTEGVSDNDTERMQHIALDLFTPETAGEFVEWLPTATPPPPTTPMPLLDELPDTPAARNVLVWVALIGAVVVVGFLLMMLAFRRIH